MRKYCCPQIGSIVGVIQMYLELLLFAQREVKIISLRINPVYWFKGVHMEREIRLYIDFIIALFGTPTRRYWERQ